MEYTVDIWLSSLPELEMHVPKLADLELIAGELSEETDIPAEALLAAPGLKYHMTLTPRRADGGELSQAELDASRRAAARFAESVSGVAMWNDADGERVTYLGGERYELPSGGIYTEMLSLCVYADPSVGLAGRAEAVVSCMEKYMPCALPEVYGDSEPPSLKYTPKTRGELLALLEKTPTPVWYARRPAVHVFWSDATGPSGSDEYRASRIELTLPDAIYEIPEWRRALLCFLRELAEASGAFFGQILRPDKNGEKNAVSAWWWRGIPMNLGAACVIGEPYLSAIEGIRKNQVERASGEAYAFFEEPNGPHIPTEFISKKRKRLFRSYTVPTREDFTVAARNLPAEK